jgi:NitT/TauT family transport system substrate-binding protein
MTNKLNPTCARDDAGPGTQEAVAKFVDAIKAARRYAACRVADPWSSSRHSYSTVALDLKIDDLIRHFLMGHGLKVGVDAIIVPVNPGTEIAAMLAGQADIAIAYQPSVAAAEAQGAKVVFDFSTYIGPFCNTGIMVLPTTIQKSPEMVQALVTSFEEASRKTYADPAFAKEVARKEFPDLPGDVVDKAIDAELKYLIPAQSVVTKQDQWKNLMEMQVYLGNAKGSIPFDQIIDNSFADKAVASLK